MLTCIRRLYKWAALAIVVGGVAATAAVIITARSTPTYQATATLQVVPANAAISPDQVNLGQAVPVAVAILQGPAVAQQVVSDLQLDHSLSGLITVTAQPGSPILTIQAKDPNPARAAEIANKIGEDFAVVTQANDQARRADQVKLLEDQLKAQEAILRSDAAALAPFAAQGSTTNSSVAADLAVLTARERVDSAIYSQLLNQLQQAHNNPLEDYQLSVVTSATAQGVTAPHDTRYLKIGLAAAAGIIAVLGVGFLLTTPVPTGQFGQSRTPSVAPQA